MKKIELEDEEWGEIIASLDNSIFDTDMKQDKDRLKEITKTQII